MRVSLQLAQLGQMLAASGGMPPGGLPGGGGGSAGGAPGGGRTVIQLTPTEAEAVERLVSMGFPKGKALEAFLACDKNGERVTVMSSHVAPRALFYRPCASAFAEEMAANYLLENMGE